MKKVIIGAILISFAILFSGAFSADGAKEIDKKQVTSELQNYMKGLMDIKKKYQTKGNSVKKNTYESDADYSTHRADAMQGYENEMNTYMESNAKTLHFSLPVTALRYDANTELAFVERVEPIRLPAMAIPAEGGSKYKKRTVPLYLCFVDPVASYKGGTLSLKSMNPNTAPVVPKALAVKLDLLKNKGAYVITLKIAPIQSQPDKPIRPAIFILDAAWVVGNETLWSWKGNPELYYNPNDFGDKYPATSFSY